jgi:hypothetical protein
MGGFREPSFGNLEARAAKESPIYPATWNQLGYVQVPRDIAPRDFNQANVAFGSMLLKKSLMRSLEPSNQLLRAFFRPALRPPVWPDWRV